jgi:hypothetical protein
VAFSYDKGETWVVVYTWEGNCPRVVDPGAITNIYDVNQDYTFTIPGNFPTGHRVIFAWCVTQYMASKYAYEYRVWINASGNREYYMSCTSVDIVGKNNGTQTTPTGPPLLLANLDPIRRECYTKEQTSVSYPQKYIGNAPIQRAPAALGLQDFPAPNPAGCGSDNATLIALIKGSSSG